MTAFALHIALMAAAAFLIGAPNPAAIAQQWRTLLRLWRKSAIVPAGSSFVFTAAPILSVAAASLAVLLVPSFTLGTPAAPASDLLVVVALLALSRAAPALAAYDALSAPQAYQSARAMAARLGAAPVLLLAALQLTLLSSGTNLDAAATALRDGTPSAHLAGALTGLALFCVALQEPPLPLGSARLRALTRLAHLLRRLALLSLTGLFLLPYGIAPPGAGLLAWAIGILCWAAKLAALGAIATAIGPRRLALPIAAILVLIAITLSAVQGAA